MNKHRGSGFDDFLREEGLYDEVEARAKCNLAKLRAMPEEELERRVLEDEDNTPLDEEFG